METSIQRKPVKGLRATGVLGRSGFTLLEVLVALAIFAMGAIVLGSAYVNVLASYVVINRTTNHDDDIYFARAALYREADLQRAEEGDEFESHDGRRVRWSAEIEPTNVADLFTVQFTCELQDRDEQQPRVVTQTFRLLRPTWSDPGDRELLRSEARERILEFQGKQP